VAVKRYINDEWVTISGLQGPVGETGPAGPTGVYRGNSEPEDTSLLWVDLDDTGSFVPYSAPTLGSTSITSGATVTNIAGLTINSTTIPTSKTLVATDSTTYVVPSQTGNSGKYLTTDGTTSSWGAVDALPSQTSNSGKYLTTNGTTSSWAATVVPGDYSAKGVTLAGTGTGTFTALTVGNNGETLVADSSTATGLRYGANFAAGKNKFINADFRFNQRNFTSTTTDGTYGFDRWYISNVGGTTTYSAQTFTPGTAPVAGYESINFARMVTSGQSGGNYAFIGQRIEDARTFAGQTVTISFWAKAASGTPSVGVTWYRTFGSGGSPSGAEYAVNAGQKTAITTSWARYSLTFAINSVSGKTFGTTPNTSSITPLIWTSAGTGFETQSASLGIQNVTIDFWGIQVEQGSTATAFQTATGTIQGELAACQRYYYRTTAPTSGNGSIAFGSAYSTSAVFIPFTYPVTMRTAPSALEYSATQVNDGVTGINANTMNLANTTASGTLLQITALSAAVTQFRPYLFIATTNGYIGVSAEL
jgi:hypothetical protein